jgi:hypothetical protein
MKPNTIEVLPQNSLIITILLFPVMFYLVRAVHKFSYDEMIISFNTIHKTTHVLLESHSRKLTFNCRPVYVKFMVEKWHWVTCFSKYSHGIQNS